MASSSEKPRRAISSYSAGRPGSGLGSTRTKRPVGGEVLAPMRTPELRVRALTGVPWGSGLTGWRQGEPSDEEEDPPVSVRLGVQVKEICPRGNNKVII